MGMKEIQQALMNESGIKVCPICSTPYKPYHSRQKTCGSPECRKIYGREYSRKRNQERKAEDPEGYRASKRKAVYKYRQKKKATQARERQLKALSEQWERQSNFDKKVSEYGLEYGKRSAEKMLETVPKIDVNIRNKGEANE